jgi:hypothetical protein
MLPPTELQVDAEYCHYHGCVGYHDEANVTQYVEGVKPRHEGLLAALKLPSLGYAKEEIPNAHLDVFPVEYDIGESD